jgi:hypothetical protein
MDFWSLDLLLLCYFIFVNSLSVKYSLSTLNLLAITFMFHAIAIFVIVGDNKMVFYT